MDKNFRSYTFTVVVVDWFEHQQKHVRNKYYYTFIDNFNITVFEYKMNSGKYAVGNKAYTTSESFNLITIIV